MAAAASQAERQREAEAAELRQLAAELLERARQLAPRQLVLVPLPPVPSDP